MPAAAAWGCASASRPCVGGNLCCSLSCSAQYKTNVWFPVICGSSSSHVFSLQEVSVLTILPWRSSIGINMPFYQLSQSACICFRISVSQSSQQHVKLASRPFRNGLCCHAAGALGNYASTVAVDRNDTQRHVMESAPAAPVDLAAIDEGKNPHD